MLAVLLGFPGLDDCKIFVGGGYRNPSMWGDSIGAGIFFCKVSASPSSETSKQFEVWKYRFWKIRSSWILTKKYIPGTWQGPNSNENRGRIYIISYSKNDNSQKLQEKPMCFIIQSSLSNWVVFHSLYTLNNRVFFTAGPTRFASAALRIAFEALEIGVRISPWPCGCSYRKL